MLFRLTVTTILLLGLYLIPIWTYTSKGNIQNIKPENNPISISISRRQVFRYFLGSIRGAQSISTFGDVGTEKAKGNQIITTVQAYSVQDNTTPLRANLSPAKTPEITQPPRSTTTTAPNPEILTKSEYPWKLNITASVFWAGDGETADNDFITNTSSAWVSNWPRAFGGIDTPDARNPNNQFYPVNFTPIENPFYVALPAAEFSENGLIPGAREASPWANETITPGGSLFKNRWVQLIHYDSSGNKHVCYAQWQDVGPAGQDGSVEQYAYVFGDESVQNTFGLGAGIDISPACAIALGFGANISQQSGMVDWRFIDYDDVPEGPWLNTITTSGPNWD